jgi:hypothetical protein
MMIDIDPKIKKKKGAEYFERPEDLDDEWVKQHIESLVEEQRTKITKKFEKDNEKLKANGEKEMKPKELNERLEAVTELEKKMKKEHKTGKVEAEGKGPTVDKMEANIDKIEQRIETSKIQMEDKEGNKEVALGTSKIVSTFCSMTRNHANIATRTTSTLVLQSSFPRSSTFLSSGSFQRRCAKSSTGRSSLLTRIGSSKSGRSLSLVRGSPNKFREDHILQAGMRSSGYQGFGGVYRYSRVQSFSGFV